MGAGGAESLADVQFGARLELEPWRFGRKPRPQLVPLAAGSGTIPLMHPPIWSISWRRCGIGAFLLTVSSLSGLCWAGSLWPFRDHCAVRKEDFCSAGVQTEAGVADLTWVGDTGILMASNSQWLSAAELWELDENETLIDSKFCKYEHDDVVSAVSQALAHKRLVVAKTSASRFGTLLSR